MRTSRNEAGNKPIIMRKLKCPKRKTAQDDGNENKRGKKMRSKKRHAEGKDARVAAGCAPPVEGHTRAKRTETKRGKGS